MSMIIDHLTYKYNAGTSFEVTALSDISLNIRDGEYIGLIGHTGSGKSTLVQNMNGLIKASEGTIYYNGADIYEKSYDIKELRTQVGMVFQYPEHQLFEATVFEDVKYGPKNQGLSDKEATLRAYEALDMVHFPKDLFTQSPFMLSGGQKRLAAIAGVLAMKPLTIILDEPTAGLDPKGRLEILSIIKELHEIHNRTIILVSHSMEDVADYASRIIVINDGKILFDDIPTTVFSHYKELEAIGLSAPEVSYLMRDLYEDRIIDRCNAITVNEAVDTILNAIKC